ncbi:nitrate reductase molybdenum cofactor assembly chaperone [Janibacter cremeus]|uniref:nitrate reductase molybdenum cofactor assembly chaperone n=1 Tax=Janibacter cremeus TaxID=1285192 RepID=UPI0023F7AC89|nr:nitrate reductase molybdenum cofactor assembly chaperone [Janibacter cremeus]WEV79540.1 nitrate reductase molybdenum cofactor assembly chaperone [Janibacter cremeus]
MMPWRRHRRSTPSLGAQAQADAWQLISLLLDYPDERLTSLRPVLRESAAGLPKAVGAPLLTFLDRLDTVPLDRVQSEYVDTFDVTRKCSLHLTYFLYGDTRKRGAALVQFKQAYRAAGVEMADEGSELPDHLSVLLEFGATTDPASAWKLLNDHRVGIELLHRALTDRESPWRPVVVALRATLPTLQGDDEQALARLIAEGPPQEEVGIDQSPYAMDPALDEAVAARPPTPQPSARADLGPTIPVGAPR